jgi:hypothetical protein
MPSCATRTNNPLLLEYPLHRNTDADKDKDNINSYRRTQLHDSKTATFPTMSDETNSDREDDLDVIFSFVSRALEIVANDNMVSESSPTSPMVSPSTIDGDPSTTIQSPSFPHFPPHPPFFPPPTAPRVVERSSSSLHRCGQFTFYFPRCSHATSHLFHLNTWSSTVCNRNCIYDQGNDYWFYADEGSHCSHCGLGKLFGIGVKQTIPDEGEGASSKERERFFEGLVRSGKLCAGPADEEARQEYNEYYLRAVEQYNKLIDGVPSSGARPTALTPAQQRTKRRERMLDRWDIRRLRARRRIEEWVRNIRTEQYDKTKSHADIDSRPYIVTPTGNPHMDLYTEVPLKSLPVPVDNCAWCQFSLSSSDAISESGVPSSLPCGHTFHYNCIVELFEKRTRAGEKERHKCPLCCVWFKDVREIPDFYGRYRDKEHIFESGCDSSVLSGSEVGDLRGHLGPPWLEEWLTEESENVCDEDEMVSLDSIHTVTLNQTMDNSIQLTEIIPEAEQTEQQTTVPALGVASEQLHPRSNRGNEEISSQPPLTQDSLHVGHGHESMQISDVFQQGLSYIVTLQLPSGVQRRTSRRRRRPRRWADESGRNSRRRVRGRRG